MVGLLEEEADARTRDEDSGLHIVEREVLGLAAFADPLSAARIGSQRRPPPANVDHRQELRDIVASLNALRYSHT